MSLHNREEFIDSMLKNYKEMIMTCINKSFSDCKTKLNIGELNNLLDEVYTSAEVDGIESRLIDNIIDECIPRQYEIAA